LYQLDTMIEENLELSLQLTTLKLRYLLRWRTKSNKLGHLGYFAGNFNQT